MSGHGIERRRELQLRGFSSGGERAQFCRDLAQAMLDVLHARLTGEEIGGFNPEAQQTRSGQHVGLPMRRDQARDQP